MRLIDADELKKAIHEEWDGILVWDESGAATADQFEMLVDSAPTIEERKKGIWFPRNSAFQKWFRCSECAYKLYELKGTNFCPNCGADMRGDRDDQK